MEALQGRTAFVTGAASGIGLAKARAFAGAGMNVILADKDVDRATEECGKIAQAGGSAIAVRLDVARRADFDSAADEAERAFGPVHILCNNAGVALVGIPFEQLAPEEWDWLISVNLKGVINGVSTFLPRFRAHGQGAHIVNTASTAGLQVSKGRFQSAYSVTKYGVVGLSEALRAELDGTGIDVSVLCPAAVRTNLLTPAALAGKARVTRAGNEALRIEIERHGLSPDIVAARVIEAIHANEFFILTHPQIRPFIEARHRALMEACDRAERFADTRE